MRLNPRANSSSEVSKAPALFYQGQDILIARQLGNYTGGVSASPPQPLEDRVVSCRLPPGEPLKVLSPLVEGTRSLSQFHHLLVRAALPLKGNNPPHVVRIVTNVHKAPPFLSWDQQIRTQEEERLVPAY